MVKVNMDKLSEAEKFLVHCVVARDDKIGELKDKLEKVEECYEDRLEDLDSYQRMIENMKSIVDKDGQSHEQRLAEVRFLVNSLVEVPPKEY